MHTENIVTAGLPLHKAGKALVLLHGRGANAQDILSLSQYLDVKDYALLAPQASNNTWYPYSFIAPLRQNEPWLSSALNVIKNVVADINLQGIASNNIYFLGFSQGLV